MSDNRKNKNYRRGLTKQRVEQIKEMGRNSIIHVGDNPNVGAPTGSRKLLTKLSKDGKYSKQEVRDTFAIVACMTEDELVRVLKDETCTALEKVAARCFDEAIKWGSYKKVKDIIEMFADKATAVSTSTVEHKVNIPAINFADPEALRKKIKGDKFDDAEIEEE